MVFTIRTPDDRFRALPGWPYKPHYVEVDGLRLARVDEGQGHPVVLLHGVPTWSYLYRTVIPPLVSAGLRAVALDTVGFGRSDKPARRDWYTYDRLVESAAGHIAAIGFDEPLTVVVHDWGGSIGLRWAVEHPDAVARLVILDTGLYAPGGSTSAAFDAFQTYVAEATSLPIGFFVTSGAMSELDEDVLGAYEAPFPDDASQAGPLALPVLIPTNDAHPSAAAMYAVLQQLESWTKPTLVLWGSDDAIIRPKVGTRLATLIPGAGELELVEGAAHFLQEDAGERIGDRIARFVAETS